MYQISQYPSREKMIEKAFKSESDGANTSNPFGKEILHPGGGGVIVEGSNRATIAARPGSSARVASAVIVALPSFIRQRIGSNCGWFVTCSSDSRRYLPELRSQSQACTGSMPFIQGIRSEKCLGKVMRFEESAVVWCVMGASADIDYRILPICRKTTCLYSQ